MNENKDLNIDETFALAVSNQQKNHFKVAENLYNKILEINPNYVSAYNNLGIISKSLGDAEKAIDYFKKTIEIKPDFIDAHNNLGVVLQGMNEKQKAKECYEKAIEINPNYSEAHCNLGVIFQSLDETQKAINCYKKAIEINPLHKNAYYNLGNSYGKLDEFNKAITNYEKSIKIDPNQPKTHHNLGNMYSNLGFNPKAIECYEKAIKINPDYVEVHYLIGVLKYQSKQYESAAKHFKLIHYRKSKSYLSSCLYNLDDKSNFLKELNDILKNGETNCIIGSTCSHAEIKYGAILQNPFCKDPLSYVVKNDLNNVCNFNDTFIKPVNKILNEDVVPAHRNQELLTNGTQTAGNLFTKKEINTDAIQSIIYAEIEKYKSLFKDSNEGLIKSWPKDYYIFGWVISMKNGSKIKPHIHEHGWLSGSVYINVPPKLKNDSGNLVLTIDNNEFQNEKDTNTKKNIDVVTGSFCLFPASLYHYTIPFNSDEERIVLAFDVLEVNQD